jgi:hypothetical protein
MREHIQAKSRRDSFWKRRGKRRGQLEGKNNNWGRRATQLRSYAATQGNNKATQGRSHPGQEVAKKRGNEVVETQKGHVGSTDESKTLILALSEHCWWV